MQMSQSPPPDEQEANNSNKRQEKNTRSSSRRTSTARASQRSSARSSSQRTPAARASQRNARSSSQRSPTARASQRSSAQSSSQRTPTARASQRSSAQSSSQRTTTLPASQRSSSRSQQRAFRASRRSPARDRPASLSHRTAELRPIAGNCTPTYMGLRLLGFTGTLLKAARADGKRFDDQGQKLLPKQLTQDVLRTLFDRLKNSSPDLCLKLAQKITRKVSEHVPHSAQSVRRYLAESLLLQHMPITQSMTDMEDSDEVLLKIFSRRWCNPAKARNKPNDLIHLIMADLERHGLYNPTEGDEAKTNCGVIWTEAYIDTGAMHVRVVLELWIRWYMTHLYPMRRSDRQRPMSRPDIDPEIEQWIEEQARNDRKSSTRQETLDLPNDLMGQATPARDAMILCLLVATQQTMEGKCFYASNAYARDMAEVRARIATRESIASRREEIASRREGVASHREVLMTPGGDINLTATVQRSAMMPVFRNGPSPSMGDPVQPRSTRSGGINRRARERIEKRRNAAKREKQKNGMNLLEATTLAPTSTVKTPAIPANQTQQTHNGDTRHKTNEDYHNAAPDRSSATASSQLRPQTIDVARNAEIEDVPGKDRDPCHNQIVMTAHNNTDDSRSRKRHKKDTSTKLTADENRNGVSEWKRPDRVPIATARTIRPQDTWNFKRRRRRQPMPTPITNQQSCIPHNNRWDSMPVKQVEDYIQSFCLNPTGITRATGLSHRTLSQHGGPPLYERVFLTGPLPAWGTPTPLYERGCFTGPLPTWAIPLPRLRFCDTDLQSNAVHAIVYPYGLRTRAVCNSRPEQSYMGGTPSRQTTSGC